MLAAGERFACARLGLSLLTGGAGRSDVARGLALLGKTCDHGEAVACYDLGVAYYDGKQVPADGAQAQARFTQACDGGDPDGCTALGLVLRAGGRAPEAREALTRGCALHDERACAALDEMKGDAAKPR